MQEVIFMRRIYTNSIRSLKSMHQSPKITGTRKKLLTVYCGDLQKKVLVTSYMYKKGTYAHALNFKIYATSIHCNHYNLNYLATAHNIKTMILNLRLVQSCSILLYL